jgi:putative SOS response-associated peptidase YedK
LVLADGFYEWQKQGLTRQPYFIKPADGLPFAMAGLWERWTDQGSGEITESFTIVTTAANEALAAIHERMPAILSREGQEAWLAAKNQAAAQGLLRPFAGGISAIPVSNFVNDPKNDSAACLDPAS